MYMLMHTTETEMRYTVEAATEWGIGGGVNGTGRRTKISGFYVVNQHGRRIRAFTGKEAEQKAREWAAFCEENFDR